MPEKKELELRSEEVQEILTRIPHWIIRWGSVVVLLILVALLRGKSTTTSADRVTVTKTVERDTDV